MFSFLSIIKPTMQFHQKKQNSIFALALAFSFFVMSASSVSAELFSSDILSPDEVMAAIEARYHLNVGSLQNQGEAMNVSSQKGYAPEVSLFFSPSDPKEGEKITAKAYPIYFSNAEASMYYTWYIKHKGCDLDNSPSAEKKILCDADDNGKITVEDWKVEAERILAENGYDNRTADYSNDPNDNDDYLAHFGGDTKVNTPSYCYIHDNDTGLNHELIKGNGDSDCNHLFPDADGETTGDGRFKASEEKFWGTNPADPSTANNGTKDEANVAGLGQSGFTWNYLIGDEVGVAVEGTSLYPTKYDDSSAMIMWAFPKKDCKPRNTGSKTVSAKGFSFEIPTAKMDLNNCIPDNLIDPTKGGQATNLSVSVTATPNDPINDAGEDKSGDTIIAQATVDNSGQNLTNISFGWKVFISDNIPAFANNGATDITDDLRRLGLLGNTRGNALDSIKLKLDIKDNSTVKLGGEQLSHYLTAGTGYLRFQANAEENFSGIITRKGNSYIIVKFTSSRDIITAYKVKATLVGDTMKVSLDTADSSGGKICDTDPLERTVCRVIKNEIVGLKVNRTGLTDFNWTINGTPLLCTARVSSDCAQGGGASKIDKIAQGNINYFPVTGNVGDTYTIVLTANDVASGKMVTLTRAFNIVNPRVIIESVDKSIAWQKFLGQYKDVSGAINPLTGQLTCPGGFCDDLSESIFQTYSGSTLGFKSIFIPGFLGSLATKEWTVDDEAKTESSTGEIAFLADKPALGIYTVNLLAQVVQPENIRRALLDIWGITQFESPETNFASAVQVEIQAPLLTEGPLSGPRKYYAAIASYIPASVLFTFRIFLSAVLTIFALSFLYSFLEERRIKTFVENFSRKQ